MCILGKKKETLAFRPEQRFVQIQDVNVGFGGVEIFDKLLRAGAAAVIAEIVRQVLRVNRVLVGSDDKQVPTILFPPASDFVQLNSPSSVEAHRL